MDERQFERLIEQYLSGELSQQGRELVDQWLDSLKLSGQQPEWSEMDEEEQARTILEKIRMSKVREIESQESFSWQDIRKPNVATEHEAGDRGILKRPLLKIAAAVALLISTLFVLYRIDQQDQEERSRMPNLVTASADRGQKLIIELPDGSSVLLNSLSAITYVADFSDSVRWVELTGEAFFEVRRNEQKSFVVKTGNLSTRVLGTTFNVRYHNLEKEIQVALLSGRVNIHTPAEDLILEKGDLAVFHRTEARTTVEKWDYARHFGWKDGMLYFNRATWPEIKEKLEIWYGVQIDIAGRHYKPGHFTGSFDNENLRNVLESLSFTFGFTYEQKDKNVLIEF